MRNERVGVLAQPVLNVVVVAAPIGDHVPAVGIHPVLDQRGEHLGCGVGGAGLVDVNVNPVDDRIQHQRMLKSTDMQIALWDISQELRSKVKYAPDDMDENARNAYEEMREFFYSKLNEYNIDLEL